MRPEVRQASFPRIDNQKLIKPGWIAPCAIVMTGTAARELQKLLEITKLNELDKR